MSKGKSLQKYYWLLLVVPSLLVCASNPFLENKAKASAGQCMERVEISNTHTPEDLLKSSAACIEEEKYTQAIDLYLVATAYGYYDSERVIEKEARDVLDAIKMDNFGALDPIKRNHFAEGLRERLNNMQESCTFLMQLGKPNYYPHYMIQSTVQSLIVKSSDGLVLNYDEKVLWHETLFTYLKCP